MRLPWMRGYVEAVVRLTKDTIMVIGWCLSDSPDVRVVLHENGRAITGPARWLRYVRPDVSDRGGPAGMLAVARLAEPLDATTIERVTIDAGDVTISTRRPLPYASTSHTAATVAARLGPLDPSTRATIHAWLLEWLSGSPSGWELALALRDLRPALEGPHPPVADRQPAARLRSILRTGDTSFYLKGSFEGPDTPVRLTATSPEGHVVDLLPLLQRYYDLPAERRWAPDAAPHGFVAHITLPSPSVLREGWMLEALDDSGRTTHAAGPEVIIDGARIRTAILEDVTREHPSRDTIIRQHVYPALWRIQEAAAAGPVIEDVLEFGAAARDPEASIVICLYRRLDFFEHQLAQFSLDDEFHRSDLIFVLDSPELGDALRDAAYELHDAYGLPFRVVLLRRNLGFAGANNAGVSIAQGRRLVLCNSDVFPSRPGWVGELARFYAATPCIGALGPKLLFEDDTIQHAGLYFERAFNSPDWWPRHYHKGFERQLPAALVTREVPAVTGACMMIDREIYTAHGGFRTCFLYGDYEDSDLCLRLRSAGLHHWYYPDVELYHLEGQSFESERRIQSSRYNNWLHTFIWGDVIARMMAECGGR